MVETGRTHRHWQREAEHTAIGGAIGRDGQSTQGMLKTEAQTLVDMGNMFNW